jgi:hypothetical protein
MRVFPDFMGSKKAVDPPWATVGTARSASRKTPSPSTRKGPADESGARETMTIEATRQ